ncbi:MAG: D-alanine--D-alanine ligase [Candidatus Pelagibacter sp.]|nr:D-alanine--D-alanine ligase [Candidatus Pelagibacter sp.]OUV87839.1 MAG: D-alanine--D-alanine ligase [Pelagibacteraceae bacterium TMED136]
MYKKKVLVLMGGKSRERSISLKSGRACFNTIKKLGYKTYKFDPIIKIEKNIRKINPDVIFNCLHGKYGEDGKIQKVLEKLRIPYTHSGIKASQNAMDKIKSKEIFSNNNIKTPKHKIIKKIFDLDKKISKDKFILKPINEGSSLGVEIFDKISQLNYKKIKNLLKRYKILMQEPFIEGKEIQTAVIGNKAIGSVEIIPKRKFYDYKAKYSSSANTLHVIPPNLSKKTHDKIKKIALKAHKVLKCKGVTRSDFRVMENGSIFILETNTQPGMTKLSLVPEIAMKYGLNFKKLVDWMIKDAGIKR